MPSKKTRIFVHIELEKKIKYEKQPPHPDYPRILGGCMYGIYNVTKSEYKKLREAVSRHSKNRSLISCEIMAMGKNTHKLKDLMKRVNVDINPRLHQFWILDPVKPKKLAK